MSIVHYIQNIYLTARRNVLENKLFQNNEKLLKNIFRPTNPQISHQIEKQITLENQAIQLQLAIIDAQEKSLGKKLNKLA